MILNGTRVRDLFMKSCGPVSADQNTGQGTAETTLVSKQLFIRTVFINKLNYK